MTDCGCGHEERLELIKELAKHHRRKLIDRNKKVDDPLFSSGASWSVYVLDRVLLACDGETDPGPLGLNGRTPTPTAVQEALFGIPETEGVIRRCRGCGTGIWPPGHGKSTAVTHIGRGLCRPCYDAAWRGGYLAEYPKRGYNREELLDEWVILCREGYTRHQAAERLGMKPESFIKALERARKDGNPRALLDWEERERKNCAS